MAIPKWASEQLKEALQEEDWFVEKGKMKMASKKKRVLIRHEANSIAWDVVIEVSPGQFATSIQTAHYPNPINSPKVPGVGFTAETLDELFLELWRHGFRPSLDEMEDYLIKVQGGNTAKNPFVDQEKSALEVAAEQWQSKEEQKEIAFYKAENHALTSDLKQQNQRVEMLEYHAQIQQKHIDDLRAMLKHLNVPLP